MRKIHRFQGNGKHILLDVASGAVHVVDPMIFDMAADMLDLSKEAMVEKYTGRYDPREVAQGYDELDYLIEEGLLYSEDTPVDLSGFNPDCHIKAMCLHVSHDCNLRCAYCFASQGISTASAWSWISRPGKKPWIFFWKTPEIDVI